MHYLAVNSSFNDTIVSNIHINLYTILNAVLLILLKADDTIFSSVYSDVSFPFFYTMVIEYF